MAASDAPLDRVVQALTVDAIPNFLVDEGIAPADAVLDGSLVVVDQSRRNRNHRATWGDGLGVLLKQAGGNYGETATLKNEAGFYAACARVAPRGQRLPLVDVVAYSETRSLLTLRWLGQAKPLWEYRRNKAGARALYSNIGNAVGSLHHLVNTRAFREDAYASSLPAAHPPWVATLHRPNPYALSRMSGAQVDILRILQEGGFAAHLDGVALAQRPSTIIHRDLKADNILVEDEDSGPKVTIVDWELAAHGDPAWDLGAMLQDTLAAWLEIIAPTNDKDLVASVANAEEATQFKYDACRALWASYLTAAEVDPGERDDLLTRSVLFSAAQLVRLAYEMSDGSDTVVSNAAALLQVAQNLFEQPRDGMQVLYGLSPGT